MIIFHFRVSVCFIIDWRFLSWDMSGFSNIHFVIYDLFACWGALVWFIIVHSVISSIFSVPSGKKLKLWPRILKWASYVPWWSPLQQVDCPTIQTYSPNMSFTKATNMLFNTNIRTGGPWASSLNWAIMCNHWSCYLVSSDQEVNVWYKVEILKSILDMECTNFTLHNEVSTFVREIYG